MKTKSSNIAQAFLPDIKYQYYIETRTQKCVSVIKSRTLVRDEVIRAPRRNNRTKEHEKLNKANRRPRQTSFLVPMPPNAVAPDATYDRRNNTTG